MKVIRVRADIDELLVFDSRYESAHGLTNSTEGVLFSDFHSPSLVAASLSVAKRGNEFTTVQKSAPAPNLYLKRKPYIRGCPVEALSIPREL